MGRMSKKLASSMWLELCEVVLKLVRKKGSTKIVFKPAIGNLERVSGMVAAELR